MKVTVKRWIADQKYNEMKAYHLYPFFECVENEDGEKYYADTVNDTVTFIVNEVVKETAKAIQFSIPCETEGARAHAPYMMWMPKSQIVAM